MVVIKEEPPSEYETTISNTFNMAAAETPEKIDPIHFGSSQLAKSSLLFKCDFCVKTFECVFHKTEHIDSVHRKIRYECPQCLKLFTAIRFAIHHMRKVHDIKSVSKTEIQTVQKVVGEVRSISGHVAKRTEIACEETTQPIDTTNGRVPVEPAECAKAYKCDYCDKQFNHKCNKDNHIDAVHKNIRHECPQCQKLFTQRKSVVTHFRRVHKMIAVPTAIRKLTIVVEMVPGESVKDLLAVSNTEQTESEDDVMLKAKQPKIEFIELEGKQDAICNGSAEQI